MFYIQILHTICYKVAYNFFYCPEGLVPCSDCAAKLELRLSEPLSLSGSGLEWATEEGPCGWSGGWSRAAPTTRQRSLVPPGALTLRTCRWRPGSPCRVGRLPGLHHLQRLLSSSVIFPVLKPGTYSPRAKGASCFCKLAAYRGWRPRDPDRRSVVLVSSSLSLFSSAS